MAEPDPFSLTGRSALVTGGGRGLGRAMALGLAARGANVALVDVDLASAEGTAEEVGRLGVRALALRGDVTVEEDAERTVGRVVEQLGGLDVLVNNAGIALMGPAEEVSLADFRRVFEIDVFGVFAFSKAAFGPMARRGKGSIVNIASMAGITVLVPQEHVGYNAAKAAVIMLTRSLAVEWAGHGIRVNALAPGYMLTPPVVALRDADPARYDYWMSQVPMRRPGEPIELQGAVVYLASDASSYMTGNVLVVDGGYTCA